jgi:hypothetical protein
MPLYHSRLCPALVQAADAFDARGLALCRATTRACGSLTPPPSPPPARVPIPHRTPRLLLLDDVDDVRRRRVAVRARALMAAQKTNLEILRMYAPAWACV